MNDNHLCLLELNEWQDYVESRPESMIFHHRSWLELLVAHYGMKLHALGLKRAGQIVAALPFLEVRTLRGPTKLVSLPFTDTSRILAARSLDASALRDGIAERYAEYGVLLNRTDELPGPDTSRSFWVCHMLDVSRPIEELMQQCPRQLHQNVRRAERRQLRVEFRRDADALQEFYQLHVRTRRRLGVPVQSRKFFGQLYNHLLSRDLGCVCLVRKGAAPVAAGVLLKFHATVVFKYAAIDADSFDDRPSDFLMYHAIRMAADAGCQTVDFGICQRSQQGLRRFKSKWGSMEASVDNDYIVGRPQPRIEDSAALKVASFAIRHGPSSLCRGIGTVFYPFSQ